MSDQLVAETSTRQNTTLTTDRHPCTGGIRTQDLSRRAALDLRLRPRGHWNRHVRYIPDTNFRRGLYNTVYPQVEGLLIFAHDSMTASIVSCTLEQQSEAERNRGNILI